MRWKLEGDGSASTAHRADLCVYAVTFPSGLSRRDGTPV